MKQPKGVRFTDMKLDYDKIKSFLTLLGDAHKPVLNTKEIFSELEYNVENDDHANEVFYYLNLLNDQGLIDCLKDKNNDLGFQFLGHGELLIITKNFRLTMQGHQTLEAMSENKVWKRIKEPLKNLGIGGLKQIPALALKLILN